MSCRPCNAAAAGLTQATRLWPNRSTASDGTCGDPAHAARESDHNPDSRGLAHAFDLTHDPAHGCDAHAQAEQIRLRAKAGNERRPKYIISNRRIAQPETSWNWVRYDGDNPHEHHAHFSINTSAENDVSPWYQPAGGLSVADIGDLLDAIRNQGEMTRDAIRNQGEKTRDAIAQSSATQTADLRRVIWRAFGKTSKEIDELEAALTAEEPPVP
jgi:hypothetical protein